MDSRLAGHFGRAPYFAVIEIEEDGQFTSIKAVANFGEHFGGRGQAHDNILGWKPDFLIVYGMGPRGLDSMAAAGVTVLQAEGRTVQEVIAAIRENKLKELVEGCNQGRGYH